jgi:26S proteasome regulatory subunit N5
MVQECCRWIFDGSITGKDEELKLIETLRTVTSGKIYVEVERARLTHKLAKMYEKDGQIAKAASTMHELQVISSLSFLICLELLFNRLF